MNVRTLTLFFIFILLPSVVWAADSLESQGDAAMSQANFRVAEAVYKRALARSETDNRILAKLEQAAILKKCDDFLSLLDREVQKKGDIRISAQQVATLMSAGEPLTMVDVRTPQEQAFVVPSKATFIQLPEIMRYLDKIPHKGTVVIVCHSGPRAMIAATALRIIGYDNVYVLKGGIMSIADINARTAPDNLK
jgi:rhodanese-related sulfurtransferase